MIMYNWLTADAIKRKILKNITEVHVFFAFYFLMYFSELLATQLMFPFAVRIFCIMRWLS